MKPRKEIVTECVNAVAACWNHYCDNKLEASMIQQIEETLDGLLLSEVQTKSWDAYAQHYQEMLDEEDKSNA